MVVVIPCYNEATRLPVDRIVEDCRAFTSLIFVNDGSTDDTAAVLDELAERIRQAGGQAAIHTLARNCGKGEAIRQGILLHLAGDDGELPVAYTDADLSTPLGELPRLVTVLSATHSDLVIGARVALMGREIKRSLIRHYVGRIAATLISEILALPVYDTQAGAKVFSASAARLLFRDPFLSRWLFDCELLLRARQAALPIYEEPLRRWIHQEEGSKIHPGTYGRALVELVRIARAYRRRGPPKRS